MRLHLASFALVLSLVALLAQPAHAQFHANWIHGGHRHHVNPVRAVLHEVGHVVREVARDTSILLGARPYGYGGYGNYCAPIASYPTYGNQMYQVPAYQQSPIYQTPVYQTPIYNRPVYVNPYSANQMCRPRHRW